MTDLDKIIKLHAALKRIAAYQTPKSLAYWSERELGISYTEALEMAYENMQHEAKMAIRGMRISKPVQKDAAP